MADAEASPAVRVRDDPACPPQEQFEVLDADASPRPETETEYPRGLRLWTTTASVAAASFLHGLDLTIVAATVPSLTNQFHTMEDIGWYSSAYSVMAASFSFTYGKLFSMVSAKRLYLASLSVFVTGSLLCTVAPTSWTFILGRALAGIGAAGISSGSVVIVSQCFPRHKLPLWTSVVGATQLLGIVCSPIVGGALIDRFSWRACFGINLPLGAAAIVLVAFGLRDLRIAPDTRLTWLEKVKKFDIIGSILIIPAVTSLLLALQWGGIRYGWADTRIIALFVLFAGLVAGFGWSQWKMQEKATLPPRILRMRSVLAGAWFNACANGTLAVTEYYVTLYFQGVKGFSATRSGFLLLPMLAGILLGLVSGGAAINRVGYYHPFMIATTILAPVASGLLTTVRLDDASVKILCLLGFLGVSVGIGIQTPIIALQTVMKAEDLPLGVAMLGFGATMGNAIWIVVSAALFQNRLLVEVSSRSPSANTTLFEHVGLSEIRDLVGDARLKDVLLGYDAAVTQTLYLPVALTVATIIGTVFMDWQTTKKKKQ